MHNEARGKSEMILRFVGLLELLFSRKLGRFMHEQLDVRNTVRVISFN